MERHARSAAIIPCFNEAGSIGALVREVAKHVDTIWVVDDGSTDATAREAERVGAVVIRHFMNLGKGASLRDGFEAVKAANVEWVFTLDGDGQHDPAEMDRFWRDADLIVGDRTAQMDQMPSIRRFVNRWTSRRLSKRLGLEIPDSQCGFRLIRVEALKAIQLQEKRFAIENEMLAAFASSGMKIQFVPISVRDAQRPSRIHPVLDTARWFRWWFR